MMNPPQPPSDPRFLGLAWETSPLDGICTARVVLPAVDPDGMDAFPVSIQFPDGQRLDLETWRDITSVLKSCAYYAKQKARAMKWKKMQRTRVHPDAARA